MSTFKLVLHHRYDTAEPHDVSGKGNVGFTSLRLGPGRDSERGALVFDGTRGRVFVPPSRTLACTGGTEVAVTVNVEALGHRRTLVEGYLSFALFVEADGALGGSILSPIGWRGVLTAPGTVALGRWMRVRFRYLSEGAMELWVDDVLRAATYVPFGGGRGTQWPFGLNVGAWPDGDQRILKGRVEEVKVWRENLAADPWLY